METRYTNVPKSNANVDVLASVDHLKEVAQKNNIGMPKFKVSLSFKEILDDFFAITGNKNFNRHKKRPKYMINVLKVSSSLLIFFLHHIIIF